MPKLGGPESPFPSFSIISYINTIMDYFESDFVKPPIPYIKRWRFSARSHTTPALTPVTLDGCRNFDRGREERAKLGPVARCCRNPPLPGDLGQQTVELEVLDPIRVGDGHSAQVFNVRVLKPESNTEIFQRTSHLVAKVYDPLYLMTTAVTSIHFSA